MQVPLQAGPPAFKYRGKKKQKHVGGWARWFQMAVRMSPRLWLHMSRPASVVVSSSFVLADDRAGTKKYLGIWLDSTLPDRRAVHTLAREPVVVVADSLHTGGDFEMAVVLLA